jgi:putative protease
MLPYLQEIFEAGICSFKVEGRNKSEYYLATVAKCYRKAVDDMLAGRPFDDSLLAEVNKTANRGFIPGYLFGQPDNGDVHYPSNSPLQTHKYVGMVTDKKNNGLYEVLVKNKLEVGEEVEIMTPSELKNVKVEELFDLEGGKVESVHGGAGRKIFKFNNGGELPVGSMLRIPC